jgi:putative mRNA 3-end processing factor
MKARYRDKLKSSFNVMPYHQPVEIGPVKVTLVPAGHILGSAQVIIDYKNLRYCYTGDFKLRADDSCQPFEIIPCDVLITETTFAQPEYDHPSEESEFEKLKQFNGFNIIIGAYNLGKAQRLNVLVNKFLPSRRIMVHPESAVYHRIYEQHGVNLGSWHPYQYRLMRNSSNNVLIAPPRALSTYLNQVGVVTTFATGWKKSPFRSHFNFHISDHADWKELLHLVKETGAGKIITVHGNGDMLKSHFSNIKVFSELKEL